MPELPTVEGFVEDLKYYIRDYDDPAGPSLLAGIYCLPRQKKDGAPFAKDAHDKKAVRSIHLLDLDDIPRDLRDRRIHSVQRVGNILELLLVRDDYDPDREDDQVVDAIRFVFKLCAEVGSVEDTDIGRHPLAYLPGTQETMEFGRTRVAALITCKNLKNTGGGRMFAFLDGLCRPNWET